MKRREESGREESKKEEKRVEEKIGEWKRTKESGREEKRMEKRVKKKRRGHSGRDDPCYKYGCRTVCALDTCQSSLHVLVTMCAVGDVCTEICERCSSHLEG